MNKFKAVIFCFAILISGCSSKISTLTHNFLGRKVEYYYSSKVGVICFQSSTGREDLIQCIPSKGLNTSSLHKDNWGVFE